MNTQKISYRQALEWAKRNGFKSLPGGHRWQFCSGVQHYPQVGDAKFLKADDRGLYGLVGFKDAS